MLEGYPTSCQEVKDDINHRHKPFINKNWVPAEIENEAVLYRLILKDRVDPNTQKPSKSSFSDYGLSVYVKSKNYPDFDIHELFKNHPAFYKCVGVVKLTAKQVRDMKFEIYSDPHPDPFQNEQHPNHVQVVCKKTTGLSRQMANLSEWVICQS